ncbi:hypothetical protein EAF04_000160 [Stromatinia cepivora]|nr:hypothetical protein EAF04_000160 [Stromatinia cepivora]
MEYEYDDSKILDKIREEFKKQFNRSQEITDIVDILVSSPKPSKKQYFLARTVQLVVFQSGWSYLGNDCIVLIPAVMSGTIEATLEERTSHRQTTFTFAQSSGSLTNSLLQIDYS